MALKLIAQTVANLTVFLLVGRSKAMPLMKVEQLVKYLAYKMSQTSYMPRHV